MDAEIGCSTEPEVGHAETQVRYVGWLERSKTHQLDFREILADLALRNLNVVIGLKVQPEFR
jgi:hypothetical protein